MTPETAPAECSPFAAGNGATEGGLHSPPAVPASDPVPVAGGDRADVAPDTPCFCPAFNYDDNVHTVSEHRSCGHTACGNCDDCDSDQIMLYRRLEREEV